MDQTKTKKNQGGGEGRGGLKIMKKDNWKTEITNSAEIKLISYIDCTAILRHKKYVGVRFRRIICFI